MIQLLPHKDLYAIKVPLTSFEYDIDKEFGRTWLNYWSDNSLIEKDLPEGNWQILGEVTKDKFSIDPKLIFCDQKDKIQYLFDLLCRNEIFFENPIGGKIINKLKGKYKEWKQYEDNLVEKVLIIQNLKT